MWYSRLWRHVVYYAYDNFSDENSNLSSILNMETVLYLSTTVYGNIGQMERTFLFSLVQ
jgi:hypothetical protein